MVDNTRNMIVGHGTKQWHTENSGVKETLAVLHKF